MIKYPKLVYTACRNALFVISACSLSLFAQTGTNPNSTASGQPATRSAGEDVAVVLDPFEVMASTNVGYGAETTSSSGRLVQNYVDVPQTVNVLTDEFLKDLNLYDSRDALAMVPNVALTDNIGQGQVYIRGELVNALYIDGMVESGGAWGSFVMPTEFYDRIEIVKGPTSAAFGVGQPGGIINYVSKTPQGKNETTITAGLGESGGHSSFNVMLDSQGSAGNSGKLLYRVVMVENQGKTGAYGGIPIGATGGQLALTYNFDPTNRVDFIVSDARENAVSNDGGAQFYSKAIAEASGYYPFPGNPNPTLTIPSLLNPKDQYQDPGFGTNSTTLLRVFLAATHRFSENTSIRNAVAIDDFDQKQDYQTAGLSAPAVPGGDPLVTSTLIYWPQSGHSFNDTLDFVDVHEFFGVKFTTLIGGDVFNTNAYQNFNLAAPPTTFDPWKPNPQDILNSLNPNQTDITHGFENLAIVSITQRGYGYYAQENVGLFDERVVLSGSWRTDKVTEYEYVYSALTQPSSGNTKGVPRFSITIKPTKWLSFYGLYSVHKDPPNAYPKYNIIGEPLPASLPEQIGVLFSAQPEGYTVEGGSKISLLDGKLTASVAVFHEIDLGTLIQGGTSFYKQPDGTTTQYSTNNLSGDNLHGYEVQITGRPTRALTLEASYGETKGNGLPFPDGYPSYLNPPTTLGGHAKYDFGANEQNGIYLTVGADWFGGTWAAQDTNFSTTGGSAHAYVPIGSQYTLDGGIGYVWNHRHQRLYLSGENLTNQVVFESGINGVGAGNLGLLQAWLTYSLTF